MTSQWMPAENADLFVCQDMIILEPCVFRQHLYKGPKCLFGDIVNQEMVLNDAGKMVV